MSNCQRRLPTADRRLKAQAAGGFKDGKQKVQFAPITSYNLINRSIPKLIRMIGLSWLPAGNDTSVFNMWMPPACMRFGVGGNEVGFLALFLTTSRRWGNH